LWRTTIHLAKCGECADDTRQQCAAIVHKKRSNDKRKLLQKRKREDDKLARECEKKKKMELFMRNGCARKQDRSAMHTGALSLFDSMNMAETDDLWVEVCLLTMVRPSLANSPVFLKFLDSYRKCSAAYKLPSNRNDGRRGSFAARLSEKEAEVEAICENKLCAASGTGFSMGSDAASVHRRGIFNICVKLPNMTKPIVRVFSDTMKEVSDGAERNAEFYCDKVVAAIKNLPHPRDCVLLIGDTAGEQELMWQMVEIDCPWISSAPCVCHVVNRILTLVGKLPKYQALLKETIEVNNWFSNHTFQRALWNKHGDLSLISPCDSRYALNFLVVFRLLRCMTTALKVVGDALYVNKCFADDIVAARVQNKGWWSKVSAMLQPVWPFVRLLRCGDSHKPLMSKVVGRQLEVEKYFDAALAKFAPGGSCPSPAMHKLYSDVYSCKDGKAMSGGTYWSKLRSEFALAAYGLDPEFHSDKPWLMRGVVSAIDKQFEKRCDLEGNALDEAQRQFDDEYELYKTKSGDLMSRARNWPKLLPDGTAIIDPKSLRPAHLFWSKVESEVPLLGPFAQQQTGQVASQSMDERSFKCYKYLVDKRSTALGRPTQGDDMPRGCRMAKARTNLQAIKSSNESPIDFSDEEAAMRSFDLGDDAHFQKMFAATIASVPAKLFRNYIEEWEEVARKSHRRLQSKRLGNKYVGMKLRDIEPPQPAPPRGRSGRASSSNVSVPGYNELREIVSIPWETAKKCYQVNTVLISSDDPSQSPGHEDTNQPYLINMALHECIKAAAAENAGVQLVPPDVPCTSLA